MRAKTAFTLASAPGSSSSSGMVFEWRPRRIIVTTSDLAAGGAGSAVASSFAGVGAAGTGSWLTGGGGCRLPFVTIAGTANPNSLPLPRRGFGRWA
jgi:hypothetical protein